DGGLVEAAFSRAAEELGVTPGSDEHAAQLDHVRATMGESKISVFRTLFGDEERAQQANAGFERAYADLVHSGASTPLPAARAAPGARTPRPGPADALRAPRPQGRTVVLTPGFARTPQDAILDALGWQDIADLTLCPADAGRGRPHPDMVLTALLRTGTGSVQ